MHLPSPWISRGFVHGFALPLAWLLPVHGLFFAFHRSHVDLILRGHPGDGRPWLDEPNGTPLGIAVGAVLVALVLGDAARRWVRSWTRRPDDRLDLFWSGLVAGILLYLALRQVGSAMQWWNAPLFGEPSRLVLFLGLSAWTASRAARLIHGPGSRVPKAILLAGAIAAFAGAFWISERFPDLQAWKSARDALRSGDPADYAHWILRNGDSSTQARIRKLAWEDLKRNPTRERASRYLSELDSLAPFRDSAAIWAGEADRGSIAPPDGTQR